MPKDFDYWNEKKKFLNSKNIEIYFYEREVWWCSMGLNIGFEQDGKNENFTRPIVVLKKFNKNVFIGIPLSTSQKEGKYYFKFNFSGKISNAILSQIRLFDSKRLVDKLGRINKHTFQAIKEKVKNIL